MAAVLMPDGQTVEMPDQLDPALGARMRAFHDSQTKPQAAAPAPRVGALEENLAGPGELLASGLANVPGAAINAASDFVHRLGGNADAPPLVPAVPVGAGGRQLMGDIAQLSGIKQTIGALHQGAGAADTALGRISPTLQDVVHQAGGVAGDVANLLPAAGAVKGVVAGAGRAAEAAATSAPGWAQRGYVSAANSPMAAGAAGPSGLHALTLQNQQVANTSLGAEAGIPHGTPLSHAAIEAGRVAPDAIKGRVAAALPITPLSPTATDLMNKIGADDLVTRSPDAQAIIEAQKSRLLAGPLTGPQVVNNTRALRQEGYARLGSDDVEQQTVGKAQVAMSKALEQHIEDTLQPNDAVSMDQWKQARVTQAKSSALQAALKGSNVDMSAIGRMQRADPGLLTGAFADAADFANAHPKVSGLANNIEVPPGFANDLGTALRSGGTPQDFLGRLFGASGVSAGARRLMTGNAADALFAARQTPVAGLAGEFEPKPLTALQSPPGRAFEPHQPTMATGARPAEQPFNAEAKNYGLQPPLGTAFEPHQPQLATGAQAELPLGQTAQEPPALADAMENTQALDRRSGGALRARFDQMTPDQKYAALYSHDVTGIPNKRAYDDSPKKATQTSVDADSLKWFNTQGSHAGGDQLLKAIAGVGHDQSPGNFFHKGGDEFVLQADSPEEAEAHMAAIHQRLAGTNIEMTAPDGRKLTVNGIGVTHGTGPTFEAADRAMEVNKAQRTAQGLRAGREQQPPGATFAPAEAGVSGD